MGKLLSVKQFSALALGQKNPPWHLGNLCALYNQTPISLKQSIAALSAAETVVFVSAGIYSNDYLLSYFSGNYDSQSLKNRGYDNDKYTKDQSFNLYWDWNATSGHDLTSILEHILKPSGLSISYLSPAINIPTQESLDNFVLEGNIIGLVGTYAAFASLNVKELPPYPSTWTAEDNSIANTSSIILNGFFAPYDETYSSDLINDANAQPLAALFPGVSSDEVGTGLLGVVRLNGGVNTKQVLVTWLALFRNSVLRLTSNLLAAPMSTGIEGAIAALNTYTDWIKGLSTLKITDVPPSIEISIPPGSPLLSISEISYRVAGPPPTTFGISAYTLNQDFTSSGGTIGD